VRGLANALRACQGKRAPLLGTWELELEPVLGKIDDPVDPLHASSAQEEIVVDILPDNEAGAQLRIVAKSNESVHPPFGHALFASVWVKRGLPALNLRLQFGGHHSVHSHDIHIHTRVDSSRPLQSRNAANPHRNVSN
jgi:hypothetical protein